MALWYMQTINNALNIVFSVLYFFQSGVFVDFEVITVSVHSCQFFTLSDCVAFFMYDVTRRFKSWLPATIPYGLKW